MHKKDALTVGPVTLNVTAKPSCKNNAFSVWNVNGLSFGPGAGLVLSADNTGLSYG